MKSFEKKYHLLVWYSDVLAFILKLLVTIFIFQKRSGSIRNFIDYSKFRFNLCDILFENTCLSIYHDFHLDFADTTRSLFDVSRNDGNFDAAD